MAFITCPKCGKQTSDIAARCVHCGCGHRVLQRKLARRRISRGGERASFLDWLKLMAAAGLLLVIVFVFGENIFPAVISAAVTFFGMVREIFYMILNL